MKKLRIGFIIAVFSVVFNYYAAGSAAELNKASKGDLNELSYLKVISPDKLKEDLDFLFKTIEEVHPNMYAYTSKEEFASLREQLYKDVNRPMTRLEFYKLTAPVVAAIKNSHTLVRPFVQEFERYFRGGGKVFPLELRWDGPKIILSKNYSSTALPLAGHVLTINGRSVHEMLAIFSRLFSTENRSTNPRIVTEQPNLLRFLLWLEYGPVESWELKTISNDGKVNSYTIKSAAATEIKGHEAKDDDVASKFSYRYFPDYNAVLLEIKSFGGELKQFEVFQHVFERFLNDSFRKIRQQKVSNLIIDVRDNEGGTESPVHRLMEYLTSEPYRLYEKAEIKISAQSSEQIGHFRQKLPDRFEGKKQGDIVAIEFPLRNPPANLLRFSGTIFVLTGSRTWSAGTVFASAMKCFNVGTLVGEETPDPPTLYGSCIFSELANSGLQFMVASKLLVAACSKPDGRGVIPDYEVKQRPEDTAKGIDTVREFTLRLISESHTKINPK